MPHDTRVVRVVPGRTEAFCICRWRSEPSAFRLISHLRAWWHRWTVETSEVGR